MLLVARQGGGGGPSGGRSCGLSDRLAASGVFVVGSTVTDAGVQPDGVVVLADHGQFGSQGLRVLDRGQLRMLKINKVLPLLYLHGLSSLDFRPALERFLGSSAGLSAATITRLTVAWQDEVKAFNARDLSGVDYVYVWADGIHVNIRLDEERLCLLLIVGVRSDGTKELVALTGFGAAECAPAPVAVKVIRPVGRSTLTAPARRRDGRGAEAAQGFACGLLPGNVGCAGPGSG